MNFRLFLKSFIYSLSALALISILVFSSIKKDVIPESSIEDENNAQGTLIPKSIPETSTISHYMLKLEEDNINIYEVYSDKSQIQCGTLDIPTQDLREIDRINFEHGIIVENANDILHITEDFTS